MDLELEQLEEELRGFSPSPVPEGVLSRMVEAMGRWEKGGEDQEGGFEGDFEGSTEAGKVVGFPLEKKSRRRGKLSLIHI